MVGFVYHRSMSRDALKLKLIFGILTAFLLITSTFAHDIPITKVLDNLSDFTSVESIPQESVALPWGDWSHYHNYTEIVYTLLYLNSTYPTLVDVFPIGNSCLNREIFCVRLTNEDFTYEKPKVLFIGYHHARERISAELPLYFVVFAATNYGANRNMAKMLDLTEIFVVVTLNVDGFGAVEVNEWQRKNARPFDEDDDGVYDEDPPDDEDGDGYVEDLYFWNGVDYEFVRWEGIDDDGDGLLNEDWAGGVDLNRNYGYEWNASVDSGSPFPSDEDYRGPSPFSEPETQAIRDLALQHNFRYAVSFHSGAESILYPWGHTTIPTPDNQIFVEVASGLSALVGAQYSQSGMWYTTSGNWEDWMYGNRSTFAFTCEIYTNPNAWQYEPGPDLDTLWEKGIFQFFNPAPHLIENTILRWMPTFTYVAYRVIEERGCDMNMDGKIDIKDLAIAARAFGSYSGHSRWLPIADINKDGKIDLVDIAIVSSNFGKILP